MSTLFFCGFWWLTSSRKGPHKKRHMTVTIIPKIQFKHLASLFCGFGPLAYLARNPQIVEQFVCPLSLFWCLQTRCQTHSVWRPFILNASRSRRGQTSVHDQCDVIRIRIWIWLAGARKATQLIAYHNKHVFLANRYCEKLAISSVRCCGNYQICIENYCNDSCLQRFFI